MGRSDDTYRDSNTRRITQAVPNDDGGEAKVAGHRRGNLELDDDEATAARQTGRLRHSHYATIGERKRKKVCVDGRQDEGESCGPPFDFSSESGE